MEQVSSHLEDCKSQLERLELENSRLAAGVHGCKQLYPTEAWGVAAEQ